MRPSRPAQAAGFGLASADRSVTALAAARGEGRKLLGKFRRSAMRAFGSLPIRRTNQDFAVPLAFLTMKLVNRHEPMVGGSTKKLKVRLVR